MISSGSTILNAQQRAEYDAHGYHFPLRAFSEAQAAALHKKFSDYWEDSRAQLAGMLPRDRRVVFTETQLFLRWVYEIVSHSAILDAVESVLGPNILVWSSQWFPKFPHDRAYVSWHQDATYWGLDPPNVTTAWVALTESTLENGCMRVMPGTHRVGILPQRETYAADNMLSRGQEIEVTVNEGKAVNLELWPGEFSLHHIGIVHGSGPNDSDRPRIGLAIRYISPEVKQRGPARDLVLLVRGHDKHGNFEIVEPPDRDVAYGESAVQAEALARKTLNVMPKPEGSKQ